MAKTVEGAFTEFKANLEITNRQEALVSSRRQNVVDVLAKSVLLHPERSKVIGSYDRHTMTKYLSEGDVDVMVILNYGDNKAWDTPEGATKALDRFRTILAAAYTSTTVRRDRNCVTMAFSEFRLDVVPAFKYDGGFYSIPDSVRGKWLQTDPFTFAERFTALNKQMGGTFVPLVKMIKAWNRQQGWPIRSFHFECLMYVGTVGLHPGVLVLVARQGFLRKTAGTPAVAGIRPRQGRSGGWLLGQWSRAVAPVDGSREGSGRGNAVGGRVRGPRQVPGHVDRAVEGPHGRLLPLLWLSRGPRTSGTSQACCSIEQRRSGTGHWGSRSWRPPPRVSLLSQISVTLPP